MTLVSWYSAYYKKQSQVPNFRNFHGLRDFYSMIKYISTRIIKDDDIENEKIIVEGIKRNFGGYFFETVVSILEE